MKKTYFFTGSILAFWTIIFALSVYPNERQVRIPENYPHIILETQPRDPRDLLRGDFVVLQYDFARQSWNDNGFSDSFLANAHAGDTAYVTFSVANDRRATPQNISHKKPKHGIFLKGKVYGKNAWNREIRFGIERFFVPAGKGIALEKAQRKNALEAEIAINPQTGKGLVVDLLVGKKHVNFDNIEQNIRFQ